MVDDAVSLSSHVLGRHGQGRVDAYQRQDLKASLVSAFDGRGGGSAVVDEEVDRFLDNGHLSDTNLSRLERRVTRRLASDRSDTCSISAASQYSRARPITGASAMSARSHRSDVSPLLLVGLQSAAAPPRTALSARSANVSAEIGTWSEVAKHSKRLEIQEKVQKRDKVTSAQAQMKEYLQMQMAEKEKRKTFVREEEARIFQHQEEEIAQWQKSQVVQQELKKKAALEVKRERELQKAEKSQRLQLQAQEKLDEDQRLVQLAHYELDAENRRSEQKKSDMKNAMSKLVNEWDSNRGNREEAKRLQVQVEKKEVVEYEKEMDRYETRKQEDLRKLCGRMNPEEIRETLAQGKAARTAKRNEEKQSDVNFMHRQHETNVKAWQAEQEKQEKLKAKMQSNKEFLFTQIDERERERREAVEAKPPLKVAAREATRDHIASEREEAHKRKLKNVNHRHELERQLEERAPPAKTSFDVMSPAERAINRQLIAEAKDLRRRVDVLG